MTPAQKSAIERPCLLGCETAQERYLWLIDKRMTLVLTVNSGYE